MNPVCGWHLLPLSSSGMDKVEQVPEEQGVCGTPAVDSFEVVLTY